MKIVVGLLITFTAIACGRPTEGERVALWKKKNQWPPNWQPESDGIKALYAEREREIMSMTGSDERWENWLQFTQSRLVPKFTEVGFEIIDTPPEVHRKLINAVKSAVEKWVNDMYSMSMPQCYSQQ
jgi:hypothetical protein